MSVNNSIYIYIYHQKCTKLNNVGKPKTKFEPSTVLTINQTRRVPLVQKTNRSK